MMSLRQRLFVVLVLGLSTLVIALVAIGHVFITADDARERAAEAGAEVAAQPLDDALLARAPGASAQEIDADQRRVLGSIVGSNAGGVGGYCTREGAILAAAASRARGEARKPGRPPAPHELAPDLREAVVRLCREARPGDTAQARVEHPRDVAILAAVPAGEKLAAWFILRVRTRSGREVGSWPVEILLLALAALALVVVAADAMLALRRGAADLRTALVRLEGDLRAPVPRPRALELREIATGLEAMATHLAEARDRERALEATLAGDQRLAALGRVAAGVAHEVRNPLAGMKLRLDLLKRSGELGAESNEDVAACLGEIDRLNRLVESLLSASRSKGGEGVLVDLAALGDERIARAAPVAEAAGIRLRRVGTASATTDPDVLAAALDNLLRNAIEASPRGSEVVVYADRADDAPSIAVEDAGPGIPEDRRAELFEPFFTTKPEGTGLGLWISRLLLEGKGASLVYGRDDGRTRMTIRFGAG
ncbi:MAG: sensor histidine kinase [Byssovorax sp.]